VSKSPWERTVEWTVAAGERLLAPVERWIGRRSLVGDATFFPLERFPWVRHVEDNWTVIREELERVLEDHAALPNFQEISKDQAGITDDDRWKTFFLYGYGFKAKLTTEMCPRTAALMEQIPGMKTAMFDDQQADRQGDRPVALRARRQAQPGSMGTALSRAWAHAGRRLIAATRPFLPGTGGLG